MAYSVVKTLFVSTLLLAVTVFAAPAAHAWFPVQVQTNFNAQEVTFQVENFWGYPVGCEGRFFAQTYSSPYGVWMNFEIGPVVAGSWGYATMVAPYAAMGDYFISIPQVAAYCQYL